MTVKQIGEGKKGWAYIFLELVAALLRWLVVCLDLHEGGVADIRMDTNTWLTTHTHEFITDR